jgi:hypothetical protein
MTNDIAKRAKSSTAKREKFRQLAENRTNNALVAIGRISNLSNRQLYEFEEAEVRKVIKALKDAVSEVESRFSSPKGKADARFKL